MGEAIDFIIEHWAWIVGIGIPLVIGVLNAASNYWGDQSGFKKWAGFLTELLGILTSKGVENGRGPLKKFKLPFQDCPPKPGREVADE